MINTPTTGSKLTSGLLHYYTPVPIKPLQTSHSVPLISNANRSDVLPTMELRGIDYNRAHAIYVLMKRNELVRYFTPIASLPQINALGDCKRCFSRTQCGILNLLVFFLPHSFPSSPQNFYLHFHQKKESLILSIPFKPHS